MFHHLFDYLLQMLFHLCCSPAGLAACFPGAVSVWPGIKAAVLPGACTQFSDVLRVLSQNKLFQPWVALILSFHLKAA